MLHPRLSRPVLSIGLSFVALASLAVPAAQAQDGPVIYPVLASSELAQGPNRFLFGLTDPSRISIAAPDVSVHLRFYDDVADPESVAFEAEARFLWAVEGVTGLYAADIIFPHAGRWGTRFDARFPDGHTDTVRADYDVRETSSTPAIGAPAPAVDSPTAADVGGDLHQISTDPDPLPRFYERSIRRVVEAGAPGVIVFATPAFCQSATCGPTLDKVKTVAAGQPDEVGFVHVEPYRMVMRDGTLQPELSAQGYLQAAPWTEAWGLVTEPFVAVIDAEGRVRAKFEGAISVEELEDALVRAHDPL